MVSNCITGIFNEIWNYILFKIIKLRCVCAVNLHIICITTSNFSFLCPFITLTSLFRRMYLNSHDISITIVEQKLPSQQDVVCASDKYIILLPSYLYNENPQKHCLHIQTILIQYEDDFGDKTVVKSSYLRIGNSYSGTMANSYKVTRRQPSDLVQSV